MKRKLLIICICLFAIKGYTQDSIVNYLDSAGNIVEKRLAIIKQVIIKKNSSWLERVYHVNGKIYYQGHFLDKKLSKKTGEFQYFNKKGEISSIINFNINGNNIYDGKYIKFLNKSKNVIGIYKNGVKYGVWYYYDLNGRKKARIVYKNDDVYKYDLWNEFGEKINEPLIIDKKLEYIGGKKMLSKKIKKELGNKLLKSKIKGNIFVVFKVTKDKKVIDLKISKKMKEKYKTMIEDFFYGLDNWNPAINFNRKVISNFVFQIQVK